MRFFSKTAGFLDKAFSCVSYRVCNVGVTVLVAMVLLVVTDIILRRFFNSPLPFTLETVEIMLSVVVFFSVAYTASKLSHVSIDVLVSHFPQRSQLIIDAIMSVISVALFSVVAWRTIIYGIHIRDIGFTTGVLGIPYYPFIFVVAFGSILLALILLTRFLNLLIKVVSE